MNEVAKRRKYAEGVLNSKMHHMFRAMGELSSSQYAGETRFNTVCSLAPERSCGEIIVRQGDSSYFSSTFDASDCKSCMMAVYAPLTSLFGLMVHSLDLANDVPVEATEGPLNRESEGLEDVNE